MFIAVRIPMCAGKFPFIARRLNEGRWTIKVQGRSWAIPHLKRGTFREDGPAKKDSWNTCPEIEKGVKNVNTVTKCDFYTSILIYLCDFKIDQKCNMLVTLGFILSFCRPGASHWRDTSKKCNLYEDWIWGTLLVWQTYSFKWLRNDYQSGILFLICLLIHTG